MKKTFKMKLASIFGAAALLFAGSAMLNMQTVSADTYTLKLAGANIEINTDTSLMFAVSTDIAYENVQLLVWDEVPAEYTVESANAEMTLTNPETRKINSTEYAVFKKPLLAKQMTDTFYLRAYANVEGVEYYSEPIKYSILEYAYTKLGYTGEAATTTENLIPLIEAMLSYGAAAQTYANYKTNTLAGKDFVYVEVANATFADGFNYGFYKAGTTSVPVTIDAGYKLSINAKSWFEEIDGTIMLTVPEGLPEGSTIIDDESFVDESVSEIPDEEKVVEKLATFNLGADGSATHKDGSSDKPTYTETDGDYTLAITGGSKMYPSSIDAKGNGCIKLGSGKAAGEFTLTVDDNITKVVLYIAGYKGDTAKITVNSGTAQTISTLSNNGEYTAIEIDTSSVKTISFTTVSGGYRVMMNTIEFHGYAE